MVCLYNLSPAVVKVTLTGEGEMSLGQDAERKKDKLIVGPNGFAFFAESVEDPLHIRFKGKSARTA